MDLTLRTESWMSDDQSWLGSKRGVNTAQSITLDTSAFTAATHYPNGFFPSGLPLGEITATGLYAPYNAAGTDGTEVLAGFLLAAIEAPDSTATNVVGALLDHGRVVVDNLPVTFTPPTDPTHFIFV